MAGYPLPPELTARVISYLTIPDNFNPYKIQEPARVAQYATVSRDWQMIVERHTFSTLHLTTPQRLTEFEQIVAQNARRRSYVRNVNLLVQLESYDVEARAKFETAEEHRRNNEIFTRTIQSLFKILQSWPEDQTGIHLSIKAQSPSDAVPGKEGQRRMKEARKNRAKDLLERRFEKCYLQFSEESLDGLPAVGAVTTLSVDAGYRFQRLISPASCAIIASKLPRLQNASLVLLDNEKRDLALRKRNRNGNPTPLKTQQWCKETLLTSITQNSSATLISGLPRWKTFISSSTMSLQLIRHVLPRISWTGMQRTP